MYSSDSFNYLWTTYLSNISDVSVLRAPRVTSADRKLSTLRRAAAVRTVVGFRVSSVGRA